MAAPPAASPVDLEGAVARLGGDVDLYQQLYPMFRQDAGAMLAQLADLAANDRRQEARRVLHTLKGLGATMGATALAAAAEQAEAAMAQEASDEDARLLANIGEAFVQTCLSMEHALPILSAAAGLVPP